jgi:hypothetical protein
MLIQSGSTPDVQAAHQVYVHHKSLAAVKQQLQAIKDRQGAEAA